MLKKNKDISNVVKALYDEFYNPDKIDQKSIDHYLAEGARYRKDYRKSLYDANIYAMEKISKLLDCKEYSNSGFTYAECYSVLMYSVQIIKRFGNENNLNKTEKKDFELSKKVLPFLCKNMKADKYSTTQELRAREKDLEEIGMDKSILNNFKNQIFEKDQEECL